MNDSSKPLAKVRIDKWLWAARFFKTRTLAQTMLKQGKVMCQGHKATPSRSIHVGDMLTIQKGDDAFEVKVLGLSEQRGPYEQARKLYEETQASLKSREEKSLKRKSNAGHAPKPEGKPDKHARRKLLKLRRDGD